MFVNELPAEPKIIFYFVDNKVVKSNQFHEHWMADYCLNENDFSPPASSRWTLKHIINFIDTCSRETDSKTTISTQLLPQLYSAAENTSENTITTEVTAADQDMTGT